MRELRKAKAELSMLTTYLADCEDMMIQYSAEWGSDIGFILDKLKATEDSFSEKSKDQITSKNEHYRGPKQKEFQEDCRVKSNTPEWAKKVFRKIALKTHPDKIKNQENSAELEDLYAKANEAIFEEDYDTLLEICGVLSIKNDIDPELELKYNEKKQKTIKAKLDKIVDSIPWIWGEAYDDIALRQNFLFSILPHYGIEDVSKKQIKDILDELSA